MTKPLSKQYDAVALLSVFWDLSTTDILSGAAFEYEPGMYHLNLEKEATTATKWNYPANASLEDLNNFILLYYYNIKSDCLNNLDDGYYIGTLLRISSEVANKKLVKNQLIPIVNLSKKSTELISTIKILIQN